MGYVILDTTFIIDLHREVVRTRPGPATEFLSSIGEEATLISVVTMGEFLDGMNSAQIPYGVGFIERFEVLPIDRSIGIHYAQISRTLRLQGQRIGDNDLWIAATALAHGYPLVTRNGKDFDRIENLNVQHY